MSKILILDDDSDIRNVLTLILAESHEVRSVTNPRIWLEETREFKPEIIILDILLGELNGLDICKELKSMPDTNQIKVILTSATLMDMEHLNQISDGYLEKPFDITTVEEMVKNI